MTEKANKKRPRPAGTSSLRGGLIKICNYLALLLKRATRASVACDNGSFSFPKECPTGLSRSDWGVGENASLSFWAGAKNLKARDKRDSSRCSEWQRKRTKNSSTLQAVHYPLRGGPISSYFRYSYSGKFPLYLSTKHHFKQQSVPKLREQINLRIICMLQIYHK